MIQGPFRKISEVGGLGLASIGNLTVEWLYLAINIARLDLTPSPCGLTPTGMKRAVLAFWGSFWRRWERFPKRSNLVPGKVDLISFYYTRSSIRNLFLK